MTVAGTFTNASAAEGAKVASEEVASDVASSIVGSVVTFMSPEQGMAPFITQLSVLLICTIGGIVHTYYKVHYWFHEKVPGDRETRKDLVYSIVFDTFWPILGVYPSIMVWFDYKVMFEVNNNPLIIYFRSMKNCLPIPSATLHLV